MSIVHKALIDVRLKLNEKLKEIDTLRHLYQAQCNEVQIWRSKYDIVMKENVQLNQLCSEQKENLSSRKCTCTSKETSKDVVDTSKKKFMRGNWRSWDELKESSKYKRKLEFKKVIETSLKKLTECKSAKVELVVGSEMVKLEWSRKNLVKLKGDIPCKKGENL